MNVVLLGVCSAFFAVSMGAFGAHLFSDILIGSHRDWYELAANYQFLHALGLMFLGLHERTSGFTVWHRRSAQAIIFGICVFSGCLYAMALGAPRWLGAVVPLGGAALLIGWVFMALAVRHESV